MTTPTPQSVPFPMPPSVPMEQAYNIKCSEVEELRKALRNIMVYLYDTDELGQEWLTPTAKAHYDHAKKVLGFLQ